MTKRKLLLGLMVFMFGVLMSACGDKNNTTNNAAADNKDFPVDWSRDKCDDCTRTYDGRFRILDEDLYLRAFDHRSSLAFDLGFELFPGDNLLSDTLNDGLNTGISTGLTGITGYLACEIATGIPRLIFSNLGGADVEREDCEVVGTDYIDGLSNTDQLDSTYYSTVQVRYRRGEVDAIALRVEDVLGGDDAVTFYRDSDNLFVSGNGELELTNSNGRLIVGQAGRRVIGEFSD